MSFQHQNLAAGGWAKLSLTEQLGNIGSEISRAIRARGNQQKFDNAVLRAFELFSLTLTDKRWHGRLKEIARAKEVFCDALLGGHEYGSTLEDLNKYFFHFAYAARLDK